MHGFLIVMTDEKFPWDKYKRNAHMTQENDLMPFYNERSFTLDTKHQFISKKNAFFLLQKL